MAELKRKDPELEGAARERQAWARMIRINDEGDTQLIVLNRSEYEQWRKERVKRYRKSKGGLST